MSRNQCKCSLAPARGPPLDRCAGVITVDVKDIPIEAYGLNDVMPPRYSPLLISAFDVMSQLTSLNPISFLLIVVPGLIREHFDHFQSAKSDGSGTPLSAHIW